MTKIVLTRRQYYLLGKKLDEVCASVDGRAVYKEGWDDDAVAANLGPPFRASHVVGARRETFGNLLKRNGSDLYALSEKIEHMETSLDALVRWATAGATRPFSPPEI